MPKQTSYNFIKSENNSATNSAANSAANSANKTLSQSKFRYLHLHKTPVFVLLSAAALKACGGENNVIPVSYEWSREEGDGDITVFEKINAESFVLKGSAENPLDFSDLEFSRQESDILSSILSSILSPTLFPTLSPTLSSTLPSIKITIPDSSVGADDGGVITIGYTDFVLPEYEINADRLRFDANGDGIVDDGDFEIPVLPQRSFTAWDGNSDTPTVAGTDEAELIIGSSLRDKIEGGEGDDYIYALGGDDSLEGGVGNDRLEGGVGNDEFFYSIGDDNDVIIEFTGGGEDTLVLQDISTNDVSKFERYNEDTLDPTGNDLRITFNDADFSYITLQNSYNSDSAGIDEIHFDNDNDGNIDTIWLDDAFSTYLT